MVPDFEVEPDLFVPVDFDEDLLSSLRTFDVVGIALTV